MKYIVGLIFILFSSSYVQSDDFIQWHSENIQVLQGFNYELGPEKRTIVTLEHANAWKYGDFFTFWDLQWPHGGDFTFYGEVIARLSLNKMLGKKLSLGPINDILLTGSLEVPKGNSATYLYGPSIDFDVPGFIFFKTSFLIRDNPNLEGTTHQFTVVWARSFEMGNTSLLFEGFADLAGSEGTTSVANQLIVPRFLFDIGGPLGMKQKQLYAGIEYTYWNNKFGIQGVRESAAQLQLKWVF